MQTQTDLGELVLALYEEYLAIYEDDDLASVAVAATLNELFAEAAVQDEDARAA
ncbi:MAG: hypothetical protein KC656_17320 [Myxococcales bacterium]|nr:hypothetical protein [Myxococcales bacterium]MCB9691779.1 hypothetical protein [Alphaproteobacteria bacterium]